MRKKRIPPSSNKLFPILLLVATIFMGVGYASINSISLNINGEVVAKAQDGIFITEVNYVERSNSLPTEDYSVLFADNTILKSSIMLEPNDISSEVSLKLSFYNSTEYDYVFKDVVYAEELTDVYSNSNIVYTFNNQNKLISKNGGTLEVIITFKYNEVNETISNILNSILNFKFAKVYSVSYVGFGSNNYIAYTAEKEQFNITFSNNINEIKIKENDEYLEQTDYSFDGVNLVVNEVNGNLEIINVDNIQIIPDFSFSNNVHTIIMGGYNVYRVNDDASEHTTLSLNGIYDLSDMLYVEFDLYIPNGYDPEQLNGVQSQLEIGSGGTRDVNEITYGLDNEIYSNLVPGFWNHVVISLSDFSNDVGDGYDITKINYIGLYWNNVNSTVTYTIPNCQIKNFKFSNYIL